LKTHALGEDDAESVENRRLGGVGLGDATQSDLAVCCGRQDDVVGLDPRQLFEDGPRRVPDARALRQPSRRARSAANFFTAPTSARQ
jgi:hypothetical protein